MISIFQPIDFSIFPIDFVQGFFFLKCTKFPSMNVTIVATKRVLGIVKRPVGFKIIHNQVHITFPN